MVKMTDEDLVKWATDELSEASQGLDKWRSQADKCYAFYAGDQWEEEDRLIMEDERERQAVTFDRITRTINAVSGFEIQNRQEIRYYPREMGDVQVSEVMSSAVKWVRHQCDADHEDSEAFMDMLICGMGWSDIYLDADAKEPNIVQERTDPLECLWDPKAKKKNLEDSKWRARIKAITKMELEQRWPDADLGLASAGTKYLDYSVTPRDVTPPRYQEENQTGTTTGETEFELVEFYWWEYEQYYQVLDINGQLIDISAEQWKSKVKEYTEENGLKWTKRRRKKYRKMQLVGKEILEIDDALSQDDFTLQCMTGMRCRNDNTWFSLISLMMDPQRWANKWLSELLHISNSNAKGGLLAESDAFENVRQAEDSWSRADSITWLQPGGLAKIQQKDIGQIPAGVDRLLQYALEAIDSVSGVNPEMLGLVDRDQPGIIEESRKRAGLTMTSIFFDAMRLYHKRVGRVLMEIIRQYIADGRLVRVVGEEGGQYVPLMKDQLALEYDVIVDEAPTSPNVKDKTFAALMQILPMAIQAGITVPPEVLEYAPLPESLIQKWKQQLNPESTPEQQAEQQQQKQITIMSQIAAVKELEASAELKRATAVEKGRQSETEDWQLKLNAAQMGFDSKMEGMKFEHQRELDRLKASYEQQKLELEAAKFGFQGQLEKESHQMEMEAMAIKNAHEIECMKYDARKFLEDDEFVGTKLISEVNGVLTEATQRQIAMMERLMGLMSTIDKNIKAPRKREIVRDKRGRAQHAIETIVIEETPNAE
jgi:hypothetical protein